MLLGQLVLVLWRPIPHTANPTSQEKPLVDNSPRYPFILEIFFTAIIVTPSRVIINPRQDVDKVDKWIHEL